MTTVIVWNNNQVKLGGHSYPGHAAVSISDGWRAGPYWPDYVSWFPVSKEDRHADPHPSFLEDLNAEGYAPDHVIRLTGLDTTQMQAVWEQILTNVKTYGFIRLNCSTIAARVLKAGSKSGGVMKRNNAIWTPLKIKRLALAMGGQKIKYDTLLAEMARAGALTSNEAIALSMLAKRDERHGRGSATPFAYFAGGKRIRERDLISLEDKGHQIAGGGGLGSGVRLNTAVVNATDQLAFGSGQVVNGDFQADT